MHKQSPLATNLKALASTRTALNMDHTHHIEKLLLFTKQKYYEFGNKSSCLLAYQLKKQNNDHSINLIRTLDGDVSCDQLVINNTFRDFYKFLYSSEKSGDYIASYLDNISLPTISEEYCYKLDAPFTSEEVWTAIQATSVISYT